MSVKPLKIAVVDDDQIYQFIIQRTISKLDQRSKVLNFSNCSDMLNFLKRNSGTERFLPDLILLDLNTPFMNGWEFLEAYDTIKQSLSKPIEIYLITSSVNPFDREKAEHQKNLDGFYCKPLKPEQLQEIVQQVLTRHL